MRTRAGRTEIPALCTELADLLRGRAPGVVICELTGPGRPGVATVEALLRLRLLAHRYGWQLRLQNPTPELVALLGLLGLAGVLTPDES
ncbi:STAS domain-containing protein [Actinoplanes sp. OR16]|uniref:STAS domain-containing protein n=1 Tax=Actinoplanes sp. OR16 TaxID=946334 RepID=UPI00135F19B5|nr:STAS domain-containing protein [Actinoplanes sp. OR16]